MSKITQRPSYQNLPWVQAPGEVEQAIRFALANIKPTDVILLGMWQKHKDQVAENVGYARKALGAA